MSIRAGRPSQFGNAYLEHRSIRDAPRRFGTLFGAPCGSCWPCRTPRQPLRSQHLGTPKDLSRLPSSARSTAAPTLALSLHLRTSCGPSRKLEPNKAPPRHTRFPPAAQQPRLVSLPLVRYSPLAEVAVAEAAPRVLLHWRSPSRSVPHPAACCSVKHFRSPPPSPTPPTLPSPGASMASPVVSLKSAPSPPMESIPPPRTFLPAEPFT